MSNALIYGSRKSTIHYNVSCFFSKLYVSQGDTFVKKSTTRKVWPNRYRYEFRRKMAGTGARYCMLRNYSSNGGLGPQTENRLLYVCSNNVKRPL